MGDFNEGHYFVDKTTCIKNDKVYGKNSNEIISKKLMDSFGLVCAKNKIIEFYKEFNCKKNKKTQEKINFSSYCWSCNICRDTIYWRWRGTFKNSKNGNYPTGKKELFKFYK